MDETHCRTVHVDSVPCRVRVDGGTRDASVEFFTSSARNKEDGMTTKPKTQNCSHEFEFSCPPMILQAKVQL